MSIIERALQKAQQARQASPATNNEVPAEPDMVPEPAAVTATGTPMADVPPVRPLHAGVAPAVPGQQTGEVVHLDIGSLRAQGRLAPESLARQTDEEIRRVKWPVLSAVRDPETAVKARNNVVLVTSAVPGEGKTFISLNLAISIARDREQSVILIDGDVAKPALTPVLGMEGRLGLVDALDDPALPIERIVYATDIEGLSFVPAGKWHEHSAEFFSSARMQQIIERLSQMASPGIVVLDSPPLLATSDAQAASRYVGQVLMIVRADFSSQREVTDALALLDNNVPARAVLNCVEASAVSRYYGNYYYGYAQHGKHRQES